MKTLRGYAGRGSAVLWNGLVLLGFFCGMVSAETWHNFPDGDRVLRYSVRPTGENFTFQFDENPGTLAAKLAAGLHVLSSVYEDDSIASRQSSFFTKEGAKCFVFDARFHTYTTCFLPNDYSPGNQERFWGYVTRVPNAYWMIAYNLLPALALLAVFGAWVRGKPASRTVPSPLAESGPARPVR